MPWQEHRRHAGDDLFPIARDPPNLLDIRPDRLAGVLEKAFELV
jgi:hypothetical protein